MESSLWHDVTVQDLTQLLRSDLDVLALAVFGSYLQPQSLDIRSDLDVLVVARDGPLERFYPALDWLAPLGTVYAYEQSSGAYRHTTRICFDDLRRIDLMIATESGLGRIKVWPRLPFYQGIQVLFSRSTQVNRILSGAVEQPDLSKVSPEQLEAMVNGFWYKGVIAVQKVVRNDLLVALHLALDMVRYCCVLGMMLRDRATGTVHHRDGGMGNQVVAELDPSSQQPLTAAGVLTMVEESSIVFDTLAGEWSEVYVPRRQPLPAWIRHARETLSG